MSLCRGPAIRRKALKPPALCADAASQEEEEGDLLFVVAEIEPGSQKDAGHAFNGKTADLYCQLL